MKKEKNMSFFRSFLNLSILIILALSFSLISCSENEAHNSNIQKQEESSYLKAVEAKYVCMITNNLYEKKQISVSINDKTFYGCCQGCVRKLNQNPESRYAIDPVSGEKVNKAIATLGAGPRGKVYYFSQRKT